MADDGKPPAIVLGLGMTGLATARALAWEGVVVYGVSLSPTDLGRASCCCHVVALEHLASDQQGLCRWLVEGEFSLRISDGTAG
ncbi:MAG TPA: hypothetical protein VNN62_18280 [Methylomirabilota bacterium]|jgi:UDP-N-acetylmuramoylalanine-D-glutamate ligase|nr:hypothetical protein [Methylomirabilota bacterium]